VKSLKNIEGDISMDYKESLFLPKTDFQMRGNLPENEPKRYKKWFDSSVYGEMKKRRVGAKSSFNLHDGPPYANGNIHIGHALNKILKDIIVKTHYFNGKDIFYRPGWDCHGLPIEQQVEKQVGVDKKNSMPKAEFRELCRAHAKKFIDIQRDEFKELGVLGLWEKPYKTMDFKFEADIYRALCKIVKKGLLVERSKPVYWSWACTTALAEAEVEYKEKESYSIYVAFPLQEESKKKLPDGAKSLIIWTTTPWTLPSNVAIAINNEEEYALTSEGYIVARKLFDKLKESGVLEGSIEAIFAPTILEGLKATNPLNSRDSLIVLGEHVSIEDGTGCVHTAPGHGEDDYIVGLKYNLPVIMPVDEKGLFDAQVVTLNLLPNPQEFVGMHIFKANEKILDLLGSNLLKCTKIKHSYPHCWRSHEPIIFRATKQWFIALDEPMPSGKTLRKCALEEIDKVRFYPAHGANRLRTMIENRPDWCISRQRDWGVPIAFFRHKCTKEVLLDENVLKKIGDIFEIEGADAWWSQDNGYFLAEFGYESEDFEKVYDVLDVWFDSGSTWFATLEADGDISGNYPAEMYLEGSDQHRGWFQSSLLVSCAINEKAPYKAVLTHGFTVDENGEKMSKSKGNVIAPKDVLKKYGSEILRMWVAMSDYEADLKISENILKQISEQYRKARNTIRFISGSICDLEGLSDDFSDIDRWILVSAKKVFDEVNTLFLNYEYAKGLHMLNEFVVGDLSGIYLDICKDRLYCNGLGSKSRVSAQSAMYLILKSMLSLYAPIITYTVDEAIETGPSLLKKEFESVFDIEYCPLPEVVSDMGAEYMLEARDNFFEIVDSLKKTKTINTTLELTLLTNHNKFLESEDFCDWFLVSNKGSIKENIEPLGEFSVGGYGFLITKSALSKCPRCWKYNAQEADSLCQRCQEVIG